MLARVTAITDEVPYIKTFELVAASDAPLPPYSPGANIEVEVRLADGSADKRSYSIVNLPGSRAFYQLAVKREEGGRGGSAYMHDQVQVGDVLDIEEPRNHFPLAEDAAEHLLIAGGIGITPILCMASALAREKRDFCLHYVARSEEMMPFKKEVIGVCGERATLWFDHGDPKKGIDLGALLRERRNEHHLYVCGPAGMIDAVLTMARGYGWPESAVHFELFSNPRAAQDADESIELVLRRSGVTLKVIPGVSILDSIIAAGVRADFDCKVGECGTCVTTVLEGAPLHRDYFLSERERAQCTSMCTCVSWAKSSRLVLDL